MTIASDMARADEITRKRSEIKPEPQIGGGFKCLVTNCPTKKELEMINQEIKIFRDTIAKQAGQIKAYQDKAKVILGKEDAQKIYEETVISTELKARDFQIEDIKMEKAKIEDRYDELRGQFVQYKTEQDQIKANWEYDEEIQEKVDNIKKMEKTIKKMEIETTRLKEIQDETKKFINESDGYISKLKQTIKDNQEIYKKAIIRNAEFKVENERLEAEIAAKKRRLYTRFLIFRKDKDLQRATDDIVKGEKIDV